LNIVSLKWDMLHYARKHGLEEKPSMTMIPVWGGAAKKFAWRVSGHAWGAKRATTDKNELWRLFNPQTDAELFRARLVHSYDSLNGVTYGSAKQREIASFAGLSYTLPWCAMTFWYAARHEAGYNGPRPDNIAYVPSWEQFAKNHNLIVPFHKALPGMAVTFCWNGRRGGPGDHIGIIDQKSTFGLSATVATDEGNASGAVRHQKRYWGNVNYIFDLAKLQK
jgi:hypothetical protein